VPGPCCSNRGALGRGRCPRREFAFEGFLPPKAAARQRVRQQLAREARTLVFYEAPHRVRESLEDLAAALGAERPAAVAREITKKFETVYRLRSGRSRGRQWRIRHAARRDRARRAGAGAGGSGEDVDADRVLRILLAELPVSQAAKLASQITGRPRKELYERALRQKGDT